jgi:hypothetical protein
MLTHVIQVVLDHIVSELRKKFGKEDPTSVHTEDIHDYLGMTIVEKLKRVMRYARSCT